MVLRLVNDAIGRTRLMYLWMLPIALLVWVFAALGQAPIPMGLMLSLMLAYTLGPVAAITTVGLRELRVLPVTNRELWLTTCVLSILVGPLFLLVVQLLAVTGVKAFTGSTAVTSEVLVLSTVCAVAYAGALLPVGPLLGYATHNVGSRRPRWLWIALTVLCITVFIGGWGLPWLLIDALPITIVQFTPQMTAMLVICLIVTGSACIWTPKRGGIATSNPAVRRVAVTSSEKNRTRFADRFTGIARIAWTQATLTVSLSAAVVLGFIGYWAAFESDTALRLFMQRCALLPFDSFQLDPGDMGGMALMFAFMLITTRSPWAPFARQLKVAPLSVHQINGLFLVTPFATWALVWLVLLVIHAAVTGLVPGTVRLDVFTLVSGLSALGHVLVFRYQGLSTGWIMGFIGGLSVGVARSLRSGVPGWAQVAVAAVGLAALGLAAFINHRTLTRSTSTSKAYAPAPPPLGISGPVAPR